MINELNLGLDDALKAIAAMMAELKRRNAAAVVAVAESRGELIALQRMDGVPLPPTHIAANKAWTAARSRKPTRELGLSLKHPEKGHDIAFHGDPKFVGWGGGVPVVIDGKVVGAVGVSGLPEEVDAEIAAIGAAAIVGKA
jgi:glc operon protein GlcG